MKNSNTLKSSITYMFQLLITKNDPLGHHILAGKYGFIGFIEGFCYNRTYIILLTYMLSGYYFLMRWT